ncbi:hypothetical protein [Paenarthrobacter sp. Z7-10]|nr:hypothetical protein [Paenarthrobacter sp. Z7-10]
MKPSIAVFGAAANAICAGAPNGSTNPETIIPASAAVLAADFR